MTDLDRLSPFAAMESMNMDENVSVPRAVISEDRRQAWRAALCTHAELMGRAERKSDQPVKYGAEFWKAELSAFDEIFPKPSTATASPRARDGVGERLALAPISLRDCKRDDRPQNGAWAPGNYMNRCHTCRCGFIGDKRAMTCADCAYTLDTAARVGDDAPVWCEGCGRDWADPPSKLCPVCQAYKGHQS